MSNQVPIYSVVPKSQYRQKTTRNKERPQNLTREFDPLNHNHGGQFQILTPTEPKIERAEKRDARKAKEESSRYKRSQTRVEPNEGKVEAYLRQNQMSIRQQQHRHSAVRQAEYRNNLRSLPLTDAVTSGSHQVRTPSDRYKGFTEREKDVNREHRRERDKDRERDMFEIDVSRQSAPYSKAERSDSRPVRKSSSSHKMAAEPAIASDQRRFVGREWAFQKIAHCLEQRPYSKTCGALVLGDAGSGKTALCQELSEPSQGPQARQQRALNRRLLARHFLQSQSGNSLRVGEFIRSVAMQILSHSSNHKPSQKLTPNNEHSPNKQEHDSPERSRHLFEDQRQLRRHRDPADDTEDCSKPLLADSEDQRTDDDEAPWCREKIIRANVAREMLVEDAPLSHADQLPEILPRTNAATNPFLVDTKLETTEATESRVYENHENLFLRNVTQRQSIRNSKLARQNSEPLSEKKTKSIQKSLSTEHRDSNSETEKSKIENSPPRSRIPVANFHYPNKSELRSSSNENSPHKTRNSDSDARSSPKKRSESQDGDKRRRDKSNSSKTSEATDKLETKPEASPEKKTTDAPEYLNVQNRDNEEAIEYQNLLTNTKNPMLDDNLNENDEVPPPIPKLPVNPRTLIADAYYEKLLTEADIQQSLLPQNLESDPDECLKKALLFPLLEMDPPKQCLFLLVDAIDEGVLNGYSCKEERDDPSTPSKSVATLLARHQHLFPQWLLLVCTARKHSKQLTKMFTGFRKITLDELQRGHVAADVQRYVLARLDTEPKLRARVSSDSTAAAAAAAALDHLRIKSDGCLLYLEKVLDGLADGFIGLREIRDIPGTLNGLFLWLAQRLFHGRRFAKVRLLLDVLLAAKTGVTEDMLYKCLLTKEYSVTRDEFNRRLHLLRRILVMERATGFLTIFHHSFARWLLDVKHCTRRYLCSPGEGHAALAMYYTLDAKRLTALEIHNYVYHMTVLEQHIVSMKKNKNSSSQEDKIVDPHTLALLWVLDSGCDVESALKRENDTFTQIEKLQDKVSEENNENIEISAEGKDVSSGKDESPLKTIMPGLGELACQWPRDARVLHTLRELSRDSTSVEQPADNEDADQLSEQLASLPIDQDDVVLDPEPALLDPLSVHELATRGDDDTLAVLLKQHPDAVELCDNSGETALHCAARAGRGGAATLLLKAGANVSAASSDGWSPLRAAAWAGHTEVVEVLLEFGCEVDCVDADNRTALRAAAWSGHEPVVTRLLAAGASPDKPDAEGRTPLIAAAYMGHADIVRSLLDAGADIDHADVDGRTALSVASLCSSGGACASLLIERGADVTRADRDGATPLLVAAFEGHTDICELLLEAEADIEACDSAGRTALWAAASAGHASTVRLLLFWGACVDNMDAEGRTVLSTAAAQGNVEVVRQLLDRGLDEHHRDNSGWTPLHYSAFEGHLEVCQALLEAGAKVDEADNDGKGPLMLAAQEGHTHLVEMLLDNWGAPVDQRAHDGKTALRLAALEGHFSTVKALYVRGADANALDADRRSTLYVLALDNRVAMARFMITECDVHVDTRDAEGRTPLHVSAWQGHTDMVNLLIKVGGAQVDGRDRCARTALHAAAWRGRVSVVRILLQYDASPAAECTQGATPLGIAAQEGHKECVLLLLQHGADPLQADHCGRTPLKVAWRAGHGDICRLLERWSAPSAPLAEEVHTNVDAVQCRASPDLKRRSVHSSNSTKSSSNLTGSENASTTQSHDKASRPNLSLSFAQQVARCGPGRREKERDNVIPEHRAIEKDPNLRSYIAHERDGDLRGYACERDRRREERHGYSAYERDNMSPLYASPPRSPVSDICSPTQTQVAFGSQPASLTTVNPVVTDQHFNRDTHMRIILGRESKPPVEKIEKAVLTLRERLSGAGVVGSLRRARRYMFKKHPKSKRNGIATNPAMRLVANVRNGLDHAAANIRRTGVALAASTSSNNPAVKTNAFQWRKETPL